jgi:hypothetical protein
MQASTPFPAWLHALSIASLSIAAACAVVISIDLVRRPQKMWIMDVVWPLTALFGGILWLAGYFVWGRAPRKGANGKAARPPFPVVVAKGASHCGAGCTLGDLIAEWAAWTWPAIAVAFGWTSLFPEKTFAVWVFDYLVAALLGVGFQYFTIKPMRDLSVGQGIWQAVKADVLSISAWQVGMYGAMAIGQFAWLKPTYGKIAPVASPEFWFVMQVAMLAGFVTSYPVNWVLIRKGVKEAM